MAIKDAISEDVVKLDAYQVQAIRHALLIGLDSFGEVERLDYEYGVETDVRKQYVSKELKPIHPTGSPDTICEFATALRYLEP